MHDGHRPTTDRLLSWAGLGGGTGWQVHAAVILRNLSVNSESEVKIVQEGSLPPLINLLRSNDVDVQVLRARALQDFEVVVPEPAHRPPTLRAAARWVTHTDAEGSRMPRSERASGFRRCPSRALSVVGGGGGGGGAGERGRRAAEPVGERPEQGPHRAGGGAGLAGAADAVAVVQGPRAGAAPPPPRGARGPHASRVPRGGGAAGGGRALSWVRSCAEPALLFGGRPRGGRGR